MDSAITLARPYARAVFSLAKQQNQIPFWNGVLASLAFIIETPKMSAWLHDPRFPKTEKMEWLMSVISAAFADAKTTQVEIKAFLALLFEENRLDVVPEMADFLQALVLKDAGEMDATVTSATALTPALKVQLEKMLAEKFNAKMSVAYTTDESLIGGFVARVHDWVMDASVQRQLSRLQERLK